MRTRTGPIDTANAIEWGHPDNAGLACLLASPVGTGGGAGSVYKDLTGKTAGATLQGGATWAGTPHGQSSPVLVSASSQYLTTTATCGAAGTLAIWASIGVTPDTTFRFLYDSAGARTLLFQNSQGVDNYALYVNGTVIKDEPNGIPNLMGAAGVPRRLVVTWDGTGSGVDLYRDGRLFSHFAVTPGAASGALLFGARYTVTNSWDGRIYGVRLLSRRASAAEVARDYEWSQDPQRDPRFRRTSTRSLFVTTAGVPSYSFVPAFAPGWGW